MDIQNKSYESYIRRQYIQFSVNSWIHFGQFDKQFITLYDINKRLWQDIWIPSKINFLCKSVCWLDSFCYNIILTGGKVQSEVS